MAHRLVSASPVSTSLRRRLQGVLLLSAAFTATAGASTEAQTRSWVALGSAGLDAQVRLALDRIQGAERQLLALRAYLRAGESLLGRWTWSDDRLSAYETTDEGRAAAADIEAVSTVFARENPGYALLVNRRPRSFELQLAHWNENPGVERVAATLQRAMRAQFGGAAATPTAPELQHALIEWTPGTAAPLAAPGLSSHGQARAFDFQVVSGDKVIASTEVASAHRTWDAAGWTRRLQRAVADSGRPFAGPLQSPYEPWHYTYAPSR